MFSGADPEEHEEFIRVGMRYVLAGVNVLNGLTASLDAIPNLIGADRNNNWRWMANSIRELGDETVRTRFLLEVIVRDQRQFFERLRSSAIAQTGELSLRAARTTGRSRWDELVGEFDKLIELDQTQGVAYYGRGLALLASVAIDQVAIGQRSADAAKSFEKAMLCAEHSDPCLAVAAARLAISWNDLLREHCDGDVLLNWAVQHLPNSPEIAFSAGLRFGKPTFLKRALELDPTLASDPLWQGMPVANAPVRNLLREQDEVIGAAITAIGKASGYDGVPLVPQRSVRACVEGIHLLTELSSVIDVTCAAIGKSTGEERDLAERVKVGSAVVRELQRRTMISRSSLPTWRLVVGSAAVAIAVCISVGIVVVGVTGVLRVIYSAYEMIARAAILSLVAAVVTSLLVLFLRVRRNRIDELEKRVAEEEVFNSNRQLENLVYIRSSVVEEISSIAVRISILTSRSLEAYPVDVLT
jgi:hypothetical protein